MQNGASGVGQVSVLVVDDEPALRELLREVLASLGYAVETAEDGAAALKKAQAQAYDVVISDVKMPGMDGRELYDRLAAVRPELSKRFLIMTGDTVAPETRRFLAERRVAHLAKPFRINELATAVQRLLSQ